MGLASCGSMGSRIVHALWLIEVDPHRSGSISLRPLLEESLPVRHAVGTCSGRLSERTYGVTPFPVSMVRLRRAVLSTGFLRQCTPVSVEGCRRPLLCRFGSSASASCAGWPSRWLNAPLLALPLSSWTKEFIHFIILVLIGTPKGKPLLAATFSN